MSRAMRLPGLSAKQVSRRPDCAAFTNKALHTGSDGVLASTADIGRIQANCGDWNVGANGSAAHGPGLTVIRAGRAVGGGSTAWK